MTAMARYTIRAAAVRRRSPAAILRLLGEAMLRQESPELVGRFCTIACLHLDLSRSPARATVACGGHPLPAILRADGTVEELGTAGHAARPRRAPGAARPRRRPARRRHDRALHGRAHRGRARPHRVWGPAELAAVLARGRRRLAAGGRRPRRARGARGPGRAARRHRGRRAARARLISRPSGGCPWPCPSSPRSASSGLSRSRSSCSPAPATSPGCSSG